MISELREVLQLMIESSLSDINTTLPGEIISYDAGRNRAIVRPSLPKALASDDELAAPRIVEVPVVWPAAMNGRASFTMPLQAGDGVMLSIQQRSIEGWLNGNRDKPDDPRQFDLSDCVAIPGLSHGGTVADDNSIVLKFGETHLTLTSSNSIIFGNEQANIMIDSEGKITLNALTIQINTPTHSFVLESHLHTQVSIGVANSGPPI